LRMGVKRREKGKSASSFSERDIPPLSGKKIRVANIKRGKQKKK